MGKGIYPAPWGQLSRKRSSALARKVIDRPAVALGGPAGSGTPPGCRLGVGLGRGLRRQRHQILHEKASAFRGPTPLRECRHFEHPYGTVEGHRHDIAQPHRSTGGGDALAIDPHMTGGGERGGGRTRAHHARMPQPLVDTLAIQISVVPWRWPRAAPSRPQAWRRASWDRAPCRGAPCRQRGP